jgi:cellulose synthase operon protein C
MERADFKEAVRLYKQLVKQEAGAEARDGLAEAYAGRARELAAKGMFEEAQIVLGNTIAADGTIRDPLLYLQCLINRGQQHKAAEHALIYIGTDKIQAPKFAELVAALLVSAPLRLDRPADSQSERAKWIEHAIAARQILAAWIEGRPPADIDQLLSRVPLRSVFKPLRLIVKALITAPEDPERASGLLNAIAPDSIFTSMRLAVEAALPRDPADRLAAWNRSSPIQQAFILEISALPNAASQSLSQLVKAERSGPASLFSFLLRQTNAYPQDDVLNACLNLLPSVPDRMQQFEKAFGPLPEFEKNRVLALSAEGRGDWRNAEQYWLAAAQTIALSQQQDEKLAAGVIYRHLADSIREQRHEDDRLLAHQAIHYLEQSLEADPDHLPTVLRLLALYRADQEYEDWERLALEATKRFPQDCAVLLQAIDAAVVRKAYKKAIGFARRLLTLDPINQSARQRMIELQISHAHRQMCASRADLAWKELTNATEWERADSPSALLRINLGLVGLALGRGTQAESQLRQGVALAGGGVAGWFRASLQDALMKGREAARLREELTRAEESAPSKQALLSIISAVGGERVYGKALTELIFGIRGWLLKGAALPWSAAEFHPLAEMFQRLEAYDLLGDFVKLAQRRDPGDPSWRLYELMAQTGGDADRLSRRQMGELIDLARSAANRSDFHMARRIGRFIEEPDDEPVPRRQGSRRAAIDRSEDEEDVLELLSAELELIPPNVVRSMAAKLGRNRATTALVGRIRALPLGSMLPEPMLREIAKAMIEGSTAIPLRVSS